MFAEPDLDTSFLYPTLQLDLSSPTLQENRVYNCYLPLTLEATSPTLQSDRVYNFNRLLDLIPSSASVPASPRRHQNRRSRVFSYLTKKCKQKQ